MPALFFVFFRFLMYVDVVAHWVDVMISVDIFARRYTDAALGPLTDLLDCRKELAGEPSRLLLRQT